MNVNKRQRIKRRDDDSKKCLKQKIMIREEKRADSHSWCCWCCWWCKGLVKKKWELGCSFVNLFIFFCFIQTTCINNNWKFDFWHGRCLFYIRWNRFWSIFTNLKNFHSKISNEMQQKWPKNTQIVIFQTYWHHAKNRTSLCGLE